jgi:uncharacterized protein
MDIATILMLCLTGMGVGFYAGLTGTGGNMILVPMLDFLLIRYGFQGEDLVRFMIANSLLMTFFTGAIVSYGQYKANNFYIREMLWVGLAGIVTAGLTTQFIKDATWYDKRKFDIVFSFMLLPVIFKMFTDKKSGVEAQIERKNPFIYIVTGLCTGVLTALSGLGGGIVMLPIFTDVLKMPIKKASSVSIGVIALLSLPVSILYLIAKPDHLTVHLPLQVGYISFGFVIPILLGVVVVSPYGIRAAQKMPPLTIRLIFGGIISIVFLKTMYRIFCS